MSIYINSTTIKTTEIINKDNNKNIINDKNNQIEISQSNGDSVNMNNNVILYNELNINNYGITTDSSPLCFSYYKMLMPDNSVIYPFIMDISILYYQIVGETLGTVSARLNYYNTIGYLRIYNNNRYEITILCANTTDTIQTSRDGPIILGFITFPNIFTKQNKNVQLYYQNIINVYGFHNTYSDSITDSAVNGIIRMDNPNSILAPTLCLSDNSIWNFTYDTSTFINLYNMTFFLVGTLN